MYVGLNKYPYEFGVYLKYEILELYQDVETMTLVTIGPVQYAS